MDANTTPTVLGPNCAACNDDTCTAPGSHHTVTEFTSRAAEDAVWEAESRKVAQEVAAEQAAAMDDHILDACREGLHRERRDLVNLYTGADRKTKIADLDLVIGAVEEEQAKRAGFASSEDILAAVSGPDFVTVQDADHLAYLLDVDEDEKAPAGENLGLEVGAATALPRPADESYTVGQRIICINLPHLGATVRSLDETGVGIDYDNDDSEDKEFGYEALYSHIRPMPLH